MATRRAATADARRHVPRHHDRTGLLVPQEDVLEHERLHSRELKHHGRSEMHRGHVRRHRDDHHTHRDRSASEHTTDTPDNEPGREHTPRPSEAYTMTKMLKSAALGAGLEAIRARREPGSWTGQKGQRVLLAAGAGAVVGSLRNGSLQPSGKLPYAEALATGFFAVEWYKKIARHTEHEKNAAEERKKWGTERKKGESHRQDSDSGRDSRHGCRRSEQRRRDS